MRIAVFSDIHANIHALQAVLDDIETQQPDRTLCLGDLVGYGAFPNEVVEMIRKSGIPTIKGNYDDGVGYERGDCGCAYKTQADRERGHESIVWTTQAVTEQNKAFLRQLLPSIELRSNGMTVKAVHGSPRRINEYLFEDRPIASLEKALDAAGTNVMVCGHTHLPYHKVIGNRHIVNDGSVGKPKHGNPLACYVILEISNTLRVHFRYVAYDYEAAAAAVEVVGLPQAFAEALRTGTG